MRKTIVLLALVGCAHNEGQGAGNAADVPRPQPVVENAIPNDLPPATPPIPKQPGGNTGEAADAGASTAINPQH